MGVSTRGACSWPSVPATPRACSSTSERAAEDVWEKTGLGRPGAGVWHRGSGRSSMRGAAGLWGSRGRTFPEGEISEARTAVPGSVVPGQGGGGQGRSVTAPGEGHVRKALAPCAAQPGAGGLDGDCAGRGGVRGGGSTRPRPQHPAGPRWDHLPLPLPRAEIWNPVPANSSALSF